MRRPERTAKVGGKPVDVELWQAFDEAAEWLAADVAELRELMTTSTVTGRPLRADWH